MLNIYDNGNIDPFDDDDSHGYFFQWRKVSPEFREAVRAICPFAFTKTRDANFCLRLLQYLLFPMLLAAGCDRVVVPCRTLAVLDDVEWTTNYRAGKRLHFFEKMTGIALYIHRWDYNRGKARSVQPVWPAALATARDAERSQFAQERPRVYFDTGERCRRSKREKQELKDFLKMRCQQALLLPENHPQRPVLELLNNQSDIVLKKIVKRNFAAACEYTLAMPVATLSERLSRDWAMDVLDAVALDSRMMYRAGQKTARVFTFYQTLHQLPREVRKILLKDCVTLDLKAAQLALAARIWNVPTLQTRLQDGDHWQMLLEELGLDAQHKATLKTATYALLFGKALGKPRKEKPVGIIPDLAVDLGGDDAAWKAAERFAQLPITCMLIAARDRRMAQVAEENGLTTVFDVHIPVPLDANTKRTSNQYRAETRSALAAEMQAYEQRLMLPALKTIANRRGVVIVSYLHDGLSLHFEDRTKKDGTVNSIIKAVDGEAKRLGIPTEMQIE